jgi:anti-sigma regulatory factor (Ser/Thr protein kinase)
MTWVMPRRTCWHLDPAPTAPGLIRAELAAWLSGWGLGPTDTEVPLLVVSELVTNAVEHAETPVAVTVILEESILDIRVRDHSRAAPILQQRDPLSVRGRGLQVIAALATSWGWTPLPDGKTVWAHVIPRA